jgi:hypothetical protein
VVPPSPPSCQPSGPAPVLAASGPAGAVAPGAEQASGWFPAACHGQVRPDPAGVLALDGHPAAAGQPAAGGQDAAVPEPGQAEPPRW